MTKEDEGTAVIDKSEEELRAEEAQAEADAEAGFSAGVAKVRGTEEPPASETKEGKDEKDTEAEAAAKATAEAKPADKPADKPAEDPWTGVAPIVREHLEKLGSKVDDIPLQISKLSGHIGGFKQKLDSITATAKEAAAKGEAAPTKVEIEEALSDPEKMAQLEADFPEWMVTTSAELKRLRKDIVAVAKSVQAPVVETKEATPIDTDSIVSQAEERAYVRLKHPDWKAICALPDFYSNWLPKQSEEIRAKAKSAEADDAIAVFDAYKAHRQKLADDEEARLKKEKRLKSAVVPEGSADPPSTGISDEDAFERGIKRVRGAQK